jgi:hypothetical protein
MALMVGYRQNKGYYQHQASWACKRPMHIPIKKHGIRANLGEYTPEVDCRARCTLEAAFHTAQVG